MDDKALRQRTINALRLATKYLGHAAEAGLMQDCVSRPQKALAVVIAVLAQYDPIWADVEIADLLLDETVSRDETLRIAIERVDALETENGRLREELREAHAQLNVAHGAMAFAGITIRRAV